MRTAYMFRGQLWYANRKPTETPTAAIARSLKRRLGADVTLWYDDRDMSGNETWRAQWFDASTETYQESLIRL